MTLIPKQSLRIKESYFEAFLDSGDVIQVCIFS